MSQLILGVDDEVHMLKLLERIIKEKTPYDIEVTSNSLEVPDLLRQKEYDLIITDLKMPGMDGLDILRLIKEKDRPEEVIIITAFGSLESAIEALSFGVFDYITKPFKKEQIIFTVDRALRWQKIKKEEKRLAAIFSAEPYTDALAKFEQEYARRLRERHQGDLTAMGRAAGLGDNRINELVRMIENGKK